MKSTSNSEILKAIKTKLSDANELRNDIVHSAWMIGYDVDNASEDILIGIRSKVFAPGFSYLGHSYSVKDFEMASNQLEMLADVVYRVLKNIQRIEKYLAELTSTL